MNAGQERFYNFIMERVFTEKQDKATALLKESFEKQANGTFNNEYIISFMPRMLELIKPEYIDEIKNIMANHKA